MIRIFLESEDKHSDKYIAFYRSINCGLSFYQLIFSETMTEYNDGNIENDDSY